MNKSEIQNVVLKMVESLQTGLVYYQSRGKKIEIFTSYKMREYIGRLTKGTEIKHIHTDVVGTVVSEGPFIVCGSPCLQVDFGGNEDAYDFEFLIACLEGESV